MINNVDLRFGFRRKRGVGGNTGAPDRPGAETPVAALAPACPGLSPPGHPPAAVRAGSAARLPARVLTLAAGLGRCGRGLPRLPGFKDGGGLGALSDGRVGQ